MLVADTHAWLWYLSEDDRLGREAEKAFDSADEGNEIIVIPSIVVAEAVYVVESHGYGVEMVEVIDDLKTSRNYRMKSLNYRLIDGLISDDRDLSIHDKIIVLTAEQTGADIISRDGEIQDLADQKVIW